MQAAVILLRYLLLSQTMCVWTSKNILNISCDDWNWSGVYAFIRWCRMSVCTYKFCVCLLHRVTTFKQICTLQTNVFCFFCVLFIILAMGTNRDVYYTFVLVLWWFCLLGYGQNIVTNGNQEETTWCYNVVSYILGSLLGLYQIDYWSILKLANTLPRLVKSLQQLDNSILEYINSYTRVFLLKVTTCV